MKPKLSILICTLPSRKAQLGSLLDQLKGQCLPYADEIDIPKPDARTSVSIGEKRNDMLQRAKGEYLAFVDDDDEISNDYIRLVMNGIESDCDCLSLRGVYYENGIESGIFEHSLKYKEWATVEGEIRFLRYPNHLNAIKSSIAKQFKFSNKNHGEDYDWSKKVHESGLIKTEHYIEDILYYYKFISNKKTDMSHSQNAEEDFILDYFDKQDNGKFVDIGAYDVTMFSNVRALYEKGWGGVLVEPSPQNYRGIQDHYKDEPRIEVLNVAIGETTGEIDFYESDGDAVSTTDEAHMKKWGDAGVKYTKIKVKQMSVLDFVHEYVFDVDMMSIDTEATNMVVFRNMPDFVWEQIKLLVIEHDGCIEEIQDKLSNFGFATLYTNGENLVLAKV